MNVINFPSKKELRQSYERYHDFFAQIISNVLVKIQSEVKLGAQPTFKSRVKSFDSYYKKILRLKSSQLSNIPDNSFIYLTDMMGIRMICAFLEDINIALEQIKQLFDVKEVEVKGAEKKFSEFGYESTHVLIKIPDSCVPELKGEFEGLERITDEIVLEIQIRTILQDAWAEVEHELIYKTEFSPFDTPLRRKLASLNASLTLADITFQEIRDYQKKLQNEIEERRQSFYSFAENLLDEKDKSNAPKENINRISPFVAGTIDDMLLQAISAHNKGNLDQAIEIYTRILMAVNPEEKNILAVISKHRGMAYFAKSDFDLALKDFDLSISCDPKAYRTYYYKGIVFSIKKDYKNAVECFSKSLELNQFQAHTTFRRATAYFELGEYENSMNDIQSAIKLGLDPDECKSLQDKLVKKFGMSM